MSGRRAAAIKAAKGETLQETASLPHCEAGADKTDSTGESAEGKLRQAKDRRRYTGWQLFNLIRNLLALAFYCFYCIFFMVKRQGSVVVNYILMVSTGVYLLLFVITGLIMGRKGKRFSGASRRVYKMTRRLVLLINTILTGGAIINMSAFESGLMIRVCAFIMIGNLILNVLWLIFSGRIERKYRRQLSGIKTSALSFARGLKTLLKKGFQGRGKDCDREDGSTGKDGPPDADSRLEAAEGGGAQQSTCRAENAGGNGEGVTEAGPAGRADNRGQNPRQSKEEEYS